MEQPEKTTRFQEGRKKTGGRKRGTPNIDPMPRIEKKYMEIYIKRGPKAATAYLMKACRKGGKFRLSLLFRIINRFT